MAIAFDQEARTSSGITTDLQLTITPGAGADCLLLETTWHSAAFSITTNTVTGSDAVSLTPILIFQSAHTTPSSDTMSVWAIFDTNLSSYGLLTWATQTAAFEDVGKRIISLSGVHQANPIITVGGSASSSESVPVVMEAIKLAGGIAVSCILTGNAANNPAPGGTWTELSENNGTGSSGDDSAAYLLSAADGVETITWTISGTAGDDNTVTVIITLRPATASVGTFESEQYWSQMAGQQAYSINHRGGAGANCAAIFVDINTSSDAAPTITYSGTVPTLRVNAGTTTDSNVLAYTITGPDDVVGSQILAVTLGSSTGACFRIIILRGISQSDPVVNAAGNADTATPGTQAVTSVAGGFCICEAAVGHSTRNISETGTPTEGEETNSEFLDSTWAYETATGASETFAFAWVSETCTMAAIAFRNQPLSPQVIWFH